MLEKQEIFDFMGGRVKIRRSKYNPTCDAVWLAASMADKKIKTVLDVGIGNGAVSLCLKAHNSTLEITGIDSSLDMLQECSENARINGWQFDLINQSIFDLSTTKTFDLVITNPPYFKGIPAQHNAHHNVDIYKWVLMCLRRVRPNGYFCTIVDAAEGANVIAAMATRCGDINVFPLFSKKKTAERVLVWGRLGTKGPTIFHFGCSINDAAILRDGLTIADILAKLDEQCLTL